MNHQKSSALFIMFSLLGFLRCPAITINLIRSHRQTLPNSQVWNNIYDAYWVGWDAETAGAAGAAGAGLSPEGPYRHYAINNQVRILVNIINETQSIQSCQHLIDLKH